MTFFEESRVRICMSGPNAEILRIIALQPIRHDQPPGTLVAIPVPRRMGR